MEFNEFLKDYSINSRIVVFVRNKHYPFYYGNRGGVVPQDLIKFMLIDHGLVVPLGENANQNKEIVRKVLRWFIHYNEKDTTKKQLFRLSRRFLKL